MQVFGSKTLPLNLVPILARLIEIKLILIVALALFLMGNTKKHFSKKKGFKVSENDVFNSFRLSQMIDEVLDILIVENRKILDESTINVEELTSSNSHTASKTKQPSKQASLSTEHRISSISTEATDLVCTTSISSINSSNANYSPTCIQISSADSFDTLRDDLIANIDSDIDHNDCNSPNNGDSPNSGTTNVSDGETVSASDKVVHRFIDELASISEEEAHTALELANIPDESAIDLSKASTVREDSNANDTGDEGCATQSEHLSVDNENDCCNYASSYVVEHSNDDENANINTNFKDNDNASSNPTDNDNSSGDGVGDVVEAGDDFKNGCNSVDIDDLACESLNDCQNNDNGTDLTIISGPVSHFANKSKNRKIGGNSGGRKGKNGQSVVVSEEITYRDDNRDSEINANEPNGDNNVNQGTGGTDDNSTESSKPTPTDRLREILFDLVHIVRGDENFDIKEIKDNLKFVRYFRMKIPAEIWFNNRRIEGCRHKLAVNDRNILHGRQGMTNNQIGRVKAKMAVLIEENQALTRGSERLEKIEAYLRARLRRIRSYVEAFDNSRPFLLGIWIVFILLFIRSMLKQKRPPTLKSP